MVTPTYGRTAIVLHWLVGLAILFQFALGWSMVRIPDEQAAEKARWSDLHYSIGMTLAAFVLVRFLWRLSHPAPELPGFLPVLQRKMARATHWLLYACMVVMPASGYLAASFANQPVAWFELALPYWDSPDLQAAMSSIHVITASLLGALIALHVAAALWHLVRRDGIFARMWRWSVERG